MYIIKKKNSNKFLVEEYTISGNKKRYTFMDFEQFEAILSYSNTHIFSIVKSYAKEKIEKAYQTFITDEEQKDSEIYKLKGSDIYGL